MARIVIAAFLAGLCSTARLPGLGDPVKILPDMAKDIVDVGAKVIQIGMKSSIYLEEDGKRMVEVIRTPIGDEIIACNMFGDRKIIKNLLENTTAEEIEVVSTEEMNDLISKCSDTLVSPTSTALSPNMTRNKLLKLFIFPGTKWCGPGTVAADNELGRSKEADKCCREHDSCDDNIPSGETKHNLTNDDFYTKSNCSCDDKFYKCLQDANTIPSHTIGIIYFNVVQIQCFKLDFPIAGCRRYTGLPVLYDSCQEYELDITKKPEWQFFDAKFYHLKSNSSFVNNTVYTIPSAFVDRVFLV